MFLDGVHMWFLLYMIRTFKLFSHCACLGRPRGVLVMSVVHLGHTKSGRLVVIDLRCGSFVVRQLQTLGRPDYRVYGACLS